MNSLEHSTTIANVGGTSQTDRAGNLGRYVRKDVTIQVGHDHDIEGIRGVGKLGRANIHNPGFIGNVRIFGGDLVKNFVEQAVRLLHNIVFNKAGDFLAVIGTSILKGVAHDLFGTRAA